MPETVIGSFGKEIMRGDISKLSQIVTEELCSFSDEKFTNIEIRHRKM